VIDISRTSPEKVTIPCGSFIVVVRYLNRTWSRFLKRSKALLSGVAYFMDDDLPAALSASELPIRYRYKILKLFHLQRASLSEICSEIWVSTVYLAEKYGLTSAAVLDPLPPVLHAPTENRITYFYEGTAAHRLEFAWLREVVWEVQRRSSNLTFVTTGGQEIRRLFAKIPRTLIFHPVPWPTYVQSLPAITHDIGLAPLLDSRFNRGRAHTKFFEITRLGAAGLYSNVSPYVGFVRAGVDGVLLDNTPGAWSDAILELAGSPRRRHDLVAHARTRAAALAAEHRALPGLGNGA
jgi:hypothetical protein